MLSRLPEELLLQVLSKLDQASLAQSVRASKQLHRICIPLLYTSVALVNVREPMSIGSLSMLNKRISSLSKTIRARPTLASHVLSLTLRFDGQKTSKGSLEALFADIMTYLSKLERLECDITGGSPGSYHKLLATAQIEASKRLRVDSRMEPPRLTEMCIAGHLRREIDDEFDLDNDAGLVDVEYYTTWYSSMDIAAAMCGALALNPEKLLLLGLVSTSSIASPPNSNLVIQSLPRTKHVEIRGSFLDPIGIGRLVEACATLETFILHAFASDVYNVRHILESLSQHGKTLQRLYIIGDGTVITRLPSLRGLVAMQELKLCPAVFFPGSLESMDHRFSGDLPPNLKRLCIVDTNYDVATRRAIERIAVLVQSWQQTLPRLEVVEIEGNLSEYYDMLLTCYHRAKSTGLKFLVIEADVTVRTQDAPSNMRYTWGFDEDDEWPPPDDNFKKRREVIDMDSEYVASSARILEEFRMT